MFALAFLDRCARSWPFDGSKVPYHNDVSTIVLMGRARPSSTESTVSAPFHAISEAARDLHLQCRPRDCGGEPSPRVIAAKCTISAGSALFAQLSGVVLADGNVAPASRANAYSAT